MKKTITYLIIMCWASLLHSQHIDRVMEYVPAPGQHINSAIGSPSSAGSLIGGINGTLSLGSFGGYVIFSFEKPVENDPGNPYGIDFTIFGNPFPNWAEHGIVWVMKDENNNGAPDDVWYELAGSQYFFLGTETNYEVTYYNPGLATAEEIVWEDNLGNTGIVTPSGFYSQPMYPDPDSFPSVSPEFYTLKGTKIPDPVNRSNPAQLTSFPKRFGYADSRPRKNPPYTLPDNPYTEEIENSGGDAFDIDWAVDVSGNYVDLDAVDFIKVQNGVLAQADYLGEVSTEITGAVDVEPANVNGVSDLVVINDLPDTISGSSYQLEALSFHNGRLQAAAQIKWTSSRSDAVVTEDHELIFSGSGLLTLTAFLQANAEISAEKTVVLQYRNTTNSVPSKQFDEITIAPNPADEFFRVRGCSAGTIHLFTVDGKLVLYKKFHDYEPVVQTGHLNSGIYLLRIETSGMLFHKRLIIR